jgi:hypothetical protein
VLIVLVIVFTIAIIAGNPQSFDLLIFVARIPANITGVYVTGAITMLVLAVAGWLLWTGIVRMRAQHKEIRDLKVAAGARTKSISAGGAAKGGKPASKSDTAEGKTADAKVDAARGERETVGGSTAKSGDVRPTRDSPAGHSESAGDVKSGTGSKDLGARDSDDSDPSSRSDHGGRQKPSGDREDDRPSTTPEERQRLLDEADEVTRDTNDK